MAINKVIFGLNTLIDLTNDTATPQDVMENKTFHDKSGTRQVGVYKRMYREGYAEYLYRTDVLNIHLDPEDVTKNVPVCKLGVNGTQVYMRCNDANRRYFVMAALKEDGQESVTGNFGDSGASNYAYTFIIERLVFFDINTVLVVYSYKSAASIADGNKVNYKYARWLHRQKNGTLTMLASAHQLSVTAYTASISEKENYYSLPCFYTPLEGNKISEIVPGMSNNGSGSWHVNSCLPKVYWFQMSLMTNTTDVVTGTWTAQPAPSAVSGVDNKISYPGFNFKARGGFCYIYTTNRPSLVMNIRGEDATYAFNSYITNYLDAADANSYKFTLALPDRPTGNVSNPPAPTTGFPYRHIGILGLMKDKTTLATLRAEFIGQDSNNKYLYELYVDFWCMNGPARWLTFVSTYELLKVYTVASSELNIFGFGQPHYNGSGIQDGITYTWNNLEEGTYYLKFKYKNEYLALPPGETTYTVIGDSANYSSFEDDFYAYSASEQNVLDTFPKSWDDIVDFAYLGMDDIFYVRTKAETGVGIARRYQLHFETDTINSIERVRMDVLDNINYRVNDGSDGSLSMRMFQNSKSDNLMNVFFTGDSVL